MKIKLLVDGGNMKPGPAIAQQIGPLGINMGKVISEVNSATKNFSGMQVPVVLDVNPKTKEFKVEVLSPPVSALLKKEAGIELASGERKKYQCGNLAIEQIISVTQQKYPNLLAKDFKKALLSVLGSAMSAGFLVESKDPKEVIEEVKQGKYDKEISSQKTEASKEKMQELKAFFSKIKTEQDARKKAEEEAKAAEEAKKAQATQQQGAQTPSQNPQKK
ncbi:MAG: 50S ribosomal protein L11 [Candidatus Pacearchaeota archaeon]